MKKFLAVLLALTMVLAMAACGSSSSSSAATTAAAAASADASSDTAESSGEAFQEHYKIGVIEVQLNDESTNRATWFREYIAPRYNVEFMFSEACTDLNAAMTFIENAADAGCQAIINYYPIGANTEQLIQLCAEYGMYFVENGGRNAANDAAYAAKYDNFCGAFMADQPDTGKLFHDYLVETLDTSVEHGFLLCTGGAYQGNAQQTEISSNMLSAISELCGLTFDKSIEELYQSDAPIEATNDKGVAVYCYPGMPSTSGWLEGLTAALQTGKYDYLLTAPNCLANIGTAVSETEAAMNQDITIIGFGTFGEALTSAMHSTDIFGNQTVAMSTVKFTSIVSTMGFAKVYNALTGHMDANLDENGEPSVILFRMNAVTSPEQLDAMSSWDTSGKWVADYDLIDSCLAVLNDGLTNEQIQENIYSYDYDAIAARLG